MSKVLLLTG